jgi:hypothetical protein
LDFIQRFIANTGEIWSREIIIDICVQYLTSLRRMEKAGDEKRTIINVIQQRQNRITKVLVLLFFFKIEMQKFWIYICIKKYAKQKEALNNIDEDLLEHPKDELIRLFEKDMMSLEITDDEDDGTTGIKHCLVPEISWRSEEVLFIITFVLVLNWYIDIYFF